MAKGSNSSAKRPRKKHTSINFKTPREKKQLELKRNSSRFELPDEVTAAAPSKHVHEEPLPVTLTSNIHKSKRNFSTVFKTLQQSNSVSSSQVEKEREGAVSNTTSVNSDRFQSPGAPPSTNNKTQENEKTKLKNRTKRAKRQSINFVAPKGRKTKDIHHQSMTGHTLTRRKSNTSANSFNSSASSISKLSDTPGHVDSRMHSQSAKDIVSSPLQPKTGQKRKLSGDKVQQTMAGGVKKRKTSKKMSPNTSFTSVTSSTTVRSKSRRSSGIPVAIDRICDLKVTKKSFEKWKPLSKLTIAFVEDVLKSVILNVSAEADLTNNEEVGRCLATLKRKIMEKLPNLKAPYTKGDYRKMESENKLSEDLYRESLRELNILNRNIEEEQRLLDEETATVVDLTKKLKNYEDELAIVQREKAHPLIRQTKNVLNLPQLPEDFFIDDEQPAKKSVEDRNLCETLLDLRENTKNSGLEKWMDKLTSFTKKLHDLP